MSFTLPPGVNAPAFLDELGEVTNQKGNEETLSEAHHRVSRLVLSQMNNYRPKQPNLVKGIKENGGNCTAFATAYSALALLTSNKSSGIIVVGSELANASHCMSALIDPVTKEFCVVDNKTFTIHCRDAKEDVAKRLKAYYQAVDLGQFSESFFGGMTTALEMIRERSCVDASASLPNYVFKDATETEKDKWSVPVGGENRYSNVFVHGFFGDAVLEIASSLSDGIETTTTTDFNDAMRCFSNSRLQ